jgi:hypothetical protein
LDSLLLALLLGLALDQGDRSQRLIRSLDAGALLPVCLVVLIGGIVPAMLGQTLSPYLPGSAGLLFFALALILGGAGLLPPAKAMKATVPANSGQLALYARLLVHRLADSPAFLLLAIAAMTGNGWTTALGGAIGGLAALLPPLIAASAHDRLASLRFLRPALGLLLMLAGLGCALRALGLA